MNKLLISLLIIGAVSLFVLGGGVGVLYQTQKDAPQIEALQATELKLQKIELVTKSLASKTISLISAYGQVQNIDGKNITLSFSGDSITVGLADNVQVLAFVGDGKGKTSYQPYDFSQIKKGYTVSVNLKLLSDGTLQGQAIIIMPPSNGSPINGTSTPNSK